MRLGWGEFIKKPVQQLKQRYTGLKTKTGNVKPSLRSFYRRPAEAQLM